MYPSEDAYKLCMKEFTHFYHLYQKHGHVEDTVFKQTSFPMERYADVTKIKCYLKITAELHQLTNIILHQHQNELHNKCITFIKS